MSPEAWAFFSLLVTTNAKALVDLASIKKNGNPDSPGSNASKLDDNGVKLDDLSALITQHTANSAAHMPGTVPPEGEASPAPVVRRHRRTTDD